MELLSADTHVRMMINNRPHSYLFSIEGTEWFSELILWYCQQCMINHVKGLLFMRML